MAINERDYYESFRRCDKPEYNNLYSKESERFKSALIYALDIRKFEIEMYWKRAQYFWTFIAIIYGGYFYTIKEPIKGFASAPFLIATIGIFFSLSWYCVNRGSKFWQNNWERHVDMLENIVHGPLYKTVMFEIGLKTEVLSAYPFSVTKINQLLSVAISFLGFGILFKEAFGLFNLSEPLKPIDIGLITWCILFAIYFVFRLFTATKSNLGEEFNREFHGNSRIVAVARECEM